MNGKVSDVRQGYEKLAGFLPYPIDLESSDFLLQTNKQIASKTVDELPLNRLTKWSVAIVEMLMLPIGAPGSSPVGHRTRVFTACRLELDINTAAERTGPLPQDSLPSLWEELERLARDIADEGIKTW